MITRRDWMVLAAIGVACLGLATYLGNRPIITREQAEAHGKTEVREAIAAKAETVYVTDTVRATAARGQLHGLRDTVLQHLTDTVSVKEYVVRVDTVLALDAKALASAAQVIRDQKAVIASKDTELVLALKPHPSPRLRYTVAALYDPIAGQPIASGGVSLRVIGGLALVARAEQRAAAGERPDVRVGVSLTF